jgi:predicted nucleic acid-binding protein
VTTLVLLDSGPLGLATNPRESADGLRLERWLAGLIAGGAWVVVPEISDYEVRRELLRAGRVKGVARLDALGEHLGVLGIDGATMRLAAELWAEARRGGYPTADDKALDADVILAAQARMAAQDPELAVVVATTNVEHLGRFVDARPWSEIG